MGTIFEIERQRERENDTVRNINIVFNYIHMNIFLNIINIRYFIYVYILLNFNLIVNSQTYNKMWR